MGEAMPLTSLSTHTHASVELVCPALARCVVRACVFLARCVVRARVCLLVSWFARRRATCFVLVSLYQYSSV